MAEPSSLLWNGERSPPGPRFPLPDREKSNHENGQLGLVLHRSPQHGRPREPGKAPAEPVSVFVAARGSRPRWSSPGPHLPRPTRGRFPGQALFRRTNSLGRAAEPQAVRRLGHQSFACFILQGDGTVPFNHSIGLRISEKYSARFATSAMVSPRRTLAEVEDQGRRARVVIERPRNSRAGRSQPSVRSRKGDATIPRMRLKPSLALLAALAASASAQTPAASPLSDEETLRHFQAIVRMNSTDPPGNEKPVIDYLKACSGLKASRSRRFRSNPTGRIWSRG